MSETTSERLVMVEQAIDYKLTELFPEWDGDQRELIADLLARVALAAMDRAPGVERKVIKRTTPVELLHEIYKQNGWRRAEGESMTKRANEHYDITADAPNNRYIATPKAQPAL